MNSQDKYEMDKEDFEKRAVRVGNTSFMSKMEIINIINKLSLFCKDEFLLTDVERVKLWILSK